jgi:hypothetical protein
MIQLDGGYLSLAVAANPDQRSEAERAGAFAGD